MGNGLLAFAAGLGSGYLSAQQRNQELARQTKLDAQNQQLFDLKMADATRANQDRSALAEAGRNVTVDNGATLGLADGTNIAYSDPGVANSDFRQLRSADQATGNQTLARAPMPSLADGQIPKTAQVATPMASLADGQVSEPSTSAAPSLADGTMPQAPQSSAVVNGKAFGSNFTGAQTAADSFNAGRAKRISDALYAQGNPAGALSMEANSQQATLNGLKVTQAQVDASREKANGIIMDQVRANGGDVAKTIAQVLTKTNAAGLAGTNVEAVNDPATNTTKMVATKPDGTKQVLKEYPTGPYGQAWMLHDLSQAPFKDTQTFLMEQGKAARVDKADENKFKFQTDTLDLKGKQVELQGELGLAKIEAAKAKLASGGAPTREERLRYTNLFSDAGRRMAETQKTAATLSKSLNEMTNNGKRPDTPAVTETRQQLAGLQNDYNSYKEERATYQTLLAGSQNSGKPGPAAPTVNPASAAAPKASPPANVLKENTVTTFANGQKWTLKGGKPTQVN